MKIAFEICEALNIPFRKMKIIINNPSLAPKTELTEIERKAIANYILNKQKKTKPATKKKKQSNSKYPKAKSAPNPLNPNEYIYPPGKFISTPMGGKSK